MTVQLEYFDGLVVSTHLIKPGRIGLHSGLTRITIRVIRVSDGDPVATLDTTRYTNLRWV